MAIQRLKEQYQKALQRQNETVFAVMDAINSDTDPAGLEALRKQNEFAADNVKKLVKEIRDSEDQLQKRVRKLDKLK